MSYHDWVMVAAAARRLRATAFMDIMKEQEQRVSKSLSERLSASMYRRDSPTKAVQHTLVDFQGSS